MLAQIDDFIKLKNNLILLTNYEMDTTTYLDNIRKAHIELMKSLQHTLNEEKRNELENMLFNAVDSIKSYLQNEATKKQQLKDELVFYEPEDDSDEQSGEFAPIHPDDDSDDEYLTINVRQQTSKNLCGNE